MVLAREIEEYHYQLYGEDQIHSKESQDTSFEKTTAVVNT
jgi:hypothetical protein